MCLEGNGNGTYFFIDEGDGNKLKGVHLSYTSSSLTQGSKNQISSNTSTHIAAHAHFAYIPDQDKYIIAMRRDATYDKFFHLISRSSSTYSIVAGTLFSNTNNENIQEGALIGRGSEFLLVWKGVDNKLYANGGKVNGSSIVWASGTGLQVTSGTYSDDTAIAYYAAAGKYYVNFNNSSTIYRSLITFSNPGVDAPVLSSSEISISANIGHGMGLTYDPDSAKMIHAWGSIEDNDGKSVVRTENSTNITSENFIGFATAAISDTASGTVAVTGNTTTQSGLTTGRKYYVTNAGGLSTTAATPSVEAGIALSSTKLLIKG